MILTRLGGLHDGVRGPRLLLTKDLGGLGQRARLIACLDIAEDVDVGRDIYFLYSIHFATNDVLYILTVFSTSSHSGNNFILITIICKLNP